MAGALLPAVIAAREVACSPTAQRLLRRAVEWGCPRDGGLALRLFRQTAGGLFSGGLISAACAAGGLPALDAALDVACSPDVTRAARRIEEGTRTRAASAGDEPRAQSAGRPSPGTDAELFAGALRKLGYSAAEIRAAGQHVDRESPGLDAGSRVRAALAWLSTRGLRSAAASTARRLGA